MSSRLIEPRQLKRIRVQLGMTQAGLADAAGVSQSIIAKIESGSVDPTFSTITAISRALSTTGAKKGKKASDVMSSPVIGVQKGTKISECVSMMKRNGFSQMPVFSGEKVVGVITETHVVSLLSESSEPGKVLQQRVGDHTQPVFAAVGRDTPVDALFSLFRYLPVVIVTSGETTEGIITKIDLLTAGV